ncbi:hypothetical protein HMPREF3212_01110 [Citrobacter freundii]|nr:hypothetical protein HMPREF3212_01110 [Citrobacter freundii]
MWTDKTFTGRSVSTLPEFLGNNFIAAIAAFQFIQQMNKKLQFMLTFLLRNNSGECFT